MQDVFSLSCKGFRLTWSFFVNHIERIVVQNHFLPSRSNSMLRSSRYPLQIYDNCFLHLLSRNRMFGRRNHRSVLFKSQIKATFLLHFEDPPRGYCSLIFKRSYNVKTQSSFKKQIFFTVIKLNISVYYSRVRSIIKRLPNELLITSFLFVKKNSSECQFQFMDDGHYSSNTIIR